LSCQICSRGNRSMAASISATVLMATDYLLPTFLSTLNSQTSNINCLK
jgi:hypothetical protein